MFLIERLTGLFTFTGFLALTLLGVSYLKNKQYKIVLWVYVIVLAVLAYLYKPWITADLYRLHFWCSTTWCTYSWSQLFEYLYRVATPMWYLFSWTIFRVTHDVNWIQMIACFWGFGNVLYVISDIIERNHVQGAKRALILFSIMAVGTFYFEMLSGIRSMLGFSIVFFCMYREIIERKSALFHIPLYIFAALLHQATLVLVVGRITFWGVESKNILLKMLSMLLIGILIPFIFIQADLYVDSAVNKAINYATNEREYSYIWEIIIGLIEQVQIYYILWTYKWQVGKESYQYSLFWKLTLIIGLVSLSALPFSYAIFRRYTIFASLCTLPLLGKLFDGTPSRKIKFFVQVMWCLSLVIFVLSCARGDLCSYKFFVLN
jgi:hypothetical protein